MEDDFKDLDGVLAEFSAPDSRIRPTALNENEYPDPDETLDDLLQKKDEGRVGEKPFQQAIENFLSRMEGQEATGSSEMDHMASLMSELSGLDLEDEEGVQKMMDELMGAMLTREMLYEPLKSLHDKLPEYLQNHGNLPKEDYERYRSQSLVLERIINLFDEDAQANRETDSTKIAELVGEMNALGAPPSELVGEGEDMSELCTTQ